jgi:hypothetical protein
MPENVAYAVAQVPQNLPQLPQLPQKVPSGIWNLQHGRTGSGMYRRVHNYGNPRSFWRSRALKTYTDRMNYLAEHTLSEPRNSACVQDLSGLHQVPELFRNSVLAAAVGVAAYHTAPLYL